jgi:hypothetical protein
MRDSRWTQIYWNYNEEHKAMMAHVRLCPNFMDTESAGFSHGISVGGIEFATEDEANKYADHLDKFFDTMIEDLNYVDEEDK